MSLTVHFGNRVNDSLGTSLVSVLCPAVSVQFVPTENPLQPCSLVGGNLPVPLTSDSACLKYLARLSGEESKTALLGKGPEEETLIDQWLELAAGASTSVVAAFDAVVKAVEQHAPKEDSGMFLVGAKLTAADAGLWGALRSSRYWANYMGKKGAETHPRTRAWYAKVDESEAAKTAVETLAAAVPKVPAMRAPPANDTELMARLQKYVARGLGALGIKDVVPESLTLPLPPQSGSDTVRDVDYCFPIFEHSKALKARPDELAGKLASVLPSSNPDEDLVLRVSTVGPYVNLTLKVEGLAAAALGTIRANAPEKSSGRHILVEFSSPNTNKPQHLGHVRNNLIGNSTAKVLQWAGNKVTKVNLVNDRGIHICKSMLAYKLFGNGETPESSGIKVQDSGSISLRYICSLFTLSIRTRLHDYIYIYIFI